MKTYSLGLADGRQVAIEDDTGCLISYRDLKSFSTQVGNIVPKRSLVFILAKNNVESLSFYVACINNHIVPLIIGEGTDEGLLLELMDRYQPNLIWMSQEKSTSFQSNKAQVVFNYESYVLHEVNNQQYQLYPDLSLLLSTSGSTGSPKLVRHSYVNILESAKSVSEFFDIQKGEGTLLPLPLQYTMGLSVASSHLFSGATVVLCQKPLTDPVFWKLLKKDNVASITGVPYTFEILDKMRFFNKDLPNLRIISQGGGKLSDDLFKKIANYCEVREKKFIATYGQTEGTARMAYLNPELATKKTGSIGNAIPNGELSLIDEEGREIEENGSVGELVYQGKNVTLGYANTIEDLAKGDENYGILKTGDIAYRDSDNCFFITGRKRRFLKIFGVRVSLDQVEHIIRSEYGIDCYCIGDDSTLVIKVVNFDDSGDIIRFVSQKTGVYHTAIEIQQVEEIKRSESGKILNT